MGQDNFKHALRITVSVAYFSASEIDKGTQNLVFLVKIHIQSCFKSGKHMTKI